MFAGQHDIFNQTGGLPQAYQQVLHNVRERDFLDSNREISPLRKAADAMELDNSDMGLEEQFERIHAHALRLIGQK